MFERLKDFLLQNKNTKQTVIKNVFWMSSSSMISRLIRGFFIIYAARILGASNYGIFSYALGLAAFFSLFGDLGVTAIFGRETLKNPNQMLKYFSTTLVTKITLCLIAAVAMFVLTPLFSKIAGLWSILPFAALLIIADNLRDFGVSFFRTKEKMEWEALILIVTNFTITLSGALVLWLHPTLVTLMVAYLSSSAFGTALTLLFFHKEIRLIPKNFDMKLIRPLMFAAIPFALSGILGGFMLNTDFVLLGWLRSSTEIGLYSAGQKIVYVIYMLPGILAGAIFPPLTRFIGKGEIEKIRALMEKALAIVYVLSIPIAIGGIVLGKSLMGFFYGTEYLGGGLSFQLLISTVIFVFPTTLLGNLIFAYDKQKALAVFSGITALGNLILDFIFIRYWGIAGCSLATLLMQILYNIFAWRFAKRLSDFTVLPHLLKIGIAGIVMGLLSHILSLFGINLLLTIAISATAYFGMLYALREHIVDEFFSLIKNVRKGTAT
ncbi:MAG: flippase [Patescibacteria group bacterium]